MGLDKIKILLYNIATLKFVENQTKEDEQVDYLPLLGGTLKVVVKSVAAPEEIISEDHGETWTEPNKETGEKEKHVCHLGEVVGDQILFRCPIENPKRVTVHFSNLDSEYIPWMAAGRRNESKPFGFSLQCQYFLNLVYSSKNDWNPKKSKPAGFEPLFVKMEFPGKFFLYAKIEIKERLDEKGKKYLLVTAKKVPENQAPEHLIKVKDSY